MDIEEVYIIVIDALTEKLNRKPDYKEVEDAVIDYISDYTDHVFETYKGVL